MVFRENIFPDFPDHVVSLDVSKIAYWPVIKFGMEIFIADQYAKFIAGDVDCNNGMAFLSLHPLKGSVGSKKIFINFFIPL